MQYFLHSFAANSVFFHLQDEDMLNVAAWEDKAMGPEPFDVCKSLIHYDSFAGSNLSQSISIPCYFLFVIAEPL